MKKIMFSLAFMLIGSFAFANNSKNVETKKIQEESFEIISIQEKLVNQKLVGTCFVSIGVYDEDGNKLKTIVLQFDNVSSAEDCDTIAGIVDDVLSGR
ncbi:hypothetical protein [Flavobacterium macrobrachii]|uniref:Uncharacterized protein n=1 Tax=Flavobacterium macrobrachii TaxID=591204 RepID=A0ABS2CVZ9_9FLAO|nr:hypothetical protein [Flavobacterium macrobrachii]MBM6499128.1 hypothetical protein [Flavobacterium macrobrachii]